MPSLAEVQRDFARSLGDPARAAPAVIHPRSPDGRSRRFDVYRNNRAVSLIDSLAATYPAVLRLVGEEFFRAAARLYIDRYPPASPVLLLYGESFDRFLDEFPPAASVPYLGDVARIEWARINAFHAADAEPIGIAALGRVPEASIDRTTFDLHPSLGLVRSAYPAVSLWSASSTSAPGVGVDMAEAQDALVVRPELEVDTRVLPAGGFTFMRQLKRGECLGVAAAAAADDEPEFDLAFHLQGLFEAGAVVSVSLPGGFEL